MERLVIEIDAYGMDGNQHTATLDSFQDLHDSPCGFGDDWKQAVRHLLEQLD